MIVFGIDPALGVTGLVKAKFTAGSLKGATGGVIKLDPDLEDSRLVELRQKITDYINPTGEPGTDLWDIHAFVVGVEENVLYPGFKSPRSALKQREAVAIAIEAALSVGALVERISPAEAKKALTGNGAAKKPQMIEAAMKVAPKIEWSGPLYWREAVADALGIAMAACQKAYKPETLL